jgi:hypothetical protein
LNITRELGALVDFYGANHDFIDRLAPWLDRYAEVVLAESGFEVLTGGMGGAAELAKTATEFGASSTSIHRFRECDAAFPGRMLGLKVDPIAGGTTLYVRSFAPLSATLTFLERIACPPVDLAPAKMVYGLGFFSRAGESGVKTYTVTDLTEAPFRTNVGSLDLSGRLSWPRPGFISHRITSSVVLDETKVYLPDVEIGALTAITPRWREILSLMTGLFSDGTCTVGIEARPSSPPETKVYVERVGAIPNDFSAR